VQKSTFIEILSGYRLRNNGTHGVNHWARVFENGRRLAPMTGADQHVVDLFALFHDARRENEGHDPMHGARGGQLAKQLRKRGLIRLTPDQLKLLTYACARHPDGLTEADLTVQTCWDADRLDLGRVGITPSPHKLCTEAAKDPEMIAWAHIRAWKGIRSCALNDWIGA
jgi:uncharacterized protein